MSYYRFFGRVVGKAIQEGVLLETQFTRFFLNKLVGKPNSFDDLKSLDSTLYDQLVNTKYYDGDVRDLGLTFEIDQVLNN